MKIQVLVAAMNQTDHSLLKKMNIQTDVIVGNQGDNDLIERFDYRGHKAVYLNFAERGVGLNRNNALMRADGDICLFADDDMVYDDGYENKVKEAFTSLPKADGIIFNIAETVQERFVIKKVTKVNYLNYLRYGTVRIAVRLSSVKENGIYFNQCFGGGTEHCHGEDNLFLTECLRKGLKIYAIPVSVARLTDERGSTWNNGYDEKYLKDQGCLYKAISRRWWRLLCLQDAVRHHDKYNMSAKKAYWIMNGKEAMPEYRGG